MTTENFEARRFSCSLLLMSVGAKKSFTYETANVGDKNGGKCGNARFVIENDTMSAKYHKKL